MTRRIATGTHKSLRPKKNGEVAKIIRKELFNRYNKSELHVNRHFHVKMNFIISIFMLRGGIKLKLIINCKVFF